MIAFKTLYQRPAHFNSRNKRPAAGSRVCPVERKARGRVEFYLKKRERKESVARLEYRNLRPLRSLRWKNPRTPSVLSAPISNWDDQIRRSVRRVSPPRKQNGARRHRGNLENHEAHILGQILSHLENVIVIVMIVFLLK